MFALFQGLAHPKRRGRLKKPLLIGYLIGDDAMLHKTRDKKREDLGKHHWTTEDKRIMGHSSVQGLYVVLGRRCPPAPQMYRQQAVCAVEGVSFESKIDLISTQTQSSRPVTIGQARREVQRRHRRQVLHWLHGQFQSG